MHISEGILSAPVLVSGAALAAVGTTVGLKKLDYDQIANVGMLSAAFFVAALIHVPVGPASVHLIFNGLVGILLGWAAFPAILVALILQAVLFQFGGITTLGANTVIMALPAVVCYYIYGGLIAMRPGNTVLAGFICGFLAVLLSTLLLGLTLVLTGQSFSAIAKFVVLAHAPVMVIEGFVTAFCIGFLQKVRPEMLPLSKAGKLR
ncbi:MAG: cobalt transporter CbiM [Desulfobacterales bacterium]|nr:cobalt transporter CbiM [Desulfobacterales bacterium]